MDYVKLIALICAVLAVLIPLCVKLYKRSEELVREKNWPRIVAAVTKYMEEAERLFEDGADKKAWVLVMIQTTAEQLEYDLTDEDIRNISDLIDTLCDMSKVVNVDDVTEFEANFNADMPVELDEGAAE